MSYVVEKDKDEKGNIVIRETDSGTKIKIKESVRKANDIARKLNLGSGFNGWTPSFVAEIV